MRRAPARAVVIRLAVAVGLGAVFLLPGLAAHADCAVDERTLEERVADAPVVFVGTTTEVTNRDRTATFDVHEIWKRADDIPEIGSQVVVRGGSDEADAGTSVDRTWQPGQRYLVFPRAEDGRFVDDICTSTRPWTDDLADARPADAREVPAGGDLDDVATATSTPWIVVGITVLAVGAATAVVAARRR